MGHADKLIDRIIFLEGHPNLQTLDPLRIGETPKETLECDLQGELDAVAGVGGSSARARDPESHRASAIRAG